jgi:hypothetical protein
MRSVERISPLSPTTEKQTLAGDCVLQVTQSPSDDSTNVNSGSPASADAASASSTEPTDATSTLPIGILSRLIELFHDTARLFDFPRMP